MESERWAHLAAVEIPINLVLVVEDDSDSAELLRAILERQGVKVRVAKEGDRLKRHLSCRSRTSSFWT